jgi:hypothetical protein
VVGSVSWPDGWAHRMARHGAEPDRAQELSGTEVREDGAVRTGQGEIGMVRGRKDRGRRCEPAGWLGASHDETRGRARHNAGAHRRGMELREDGPVSIGQVEIGVI